MTRPRWISIQEGSCHLVLQRQCLPTPRYRSPEEPALTRSLTSRREPREKRGETRELENGLGKQVQGLFPQNQGETAQMHHGKVPTGPHVYRRLPLSASLMLRQNVQEAGVKWSFTFVL